MPRSKESFEAMRETTRQKIEAVALSLFARKGLSVTIDEIAKTAKISKGLIYNHYPSKEALIYEFVRRAITISSQNVMTVVNMEGSAADKIQLTTDTMCQMFTVAPHGIDYFMFMSQVQMSGFQVPEELLYSDDLPNPIQSFTIVLEQGQKEGSVIPEDPYQLSIIYWAAIQGLCCYVSTGIPVSPQPQILNRIVLREEFI